MNISDLAEDYLIDRKEGMRKLTASLLNEVMQLEAEKQIQARRYERTGKRRAHRNGTRPRSLKTIHGEIELDKPQIREFPFKTKVSRDILAWKNLYELLLRNRISKEYQQEKSRKYSRNSDWKTSLPPKFQELRRSWIN